VVRRAIKYRGDMGERQDTNGLTTALQLLGAAGHADGQAEQDELFEAPGPLPLPTAPRPAGKVGRPKGARNKSTEEWVRFLLSRYRSPLTVLAELYSRPLDELVDELQRMANKHQTWRETASGGHTERVQINPLEVLKMQRDAAVALLPYVHKRQPMALEVEQRQRGIVVLGHLDTTDLGGDDDLALPLMPTEENQEVRAAEAQQSHGQKSHDAEMSRDANGIASDGS
jgi:hypothetical protein